jgi:phosphoribosylformylglycinamidine synthase subunit PurS
VSHWSAHVRVTLKTAVNDPQGLAIRGGLQQLGFVDVTGVRAGKYFDVQLQAADRSKAEQAVDEMCRRLLANPVIEDYSYDVSEEPA